jgi:hypothetical protein
MVSNQFYVKLKTEKDTTDLKRIVSQTNTTILRKMLYTTNWYVLGTKNDDGFKNVKEWVDELGITHKNFNNIIRVLK